MSYTNLTINEQTKIEILLEEGLSIRAIARKLKRHPSTISREVVRYAGCSAIGHRHAIERIRRVVVRS